MSPSHVTSHIKSFVRRQGRVSVMQKALWFSVEQDLWPQYGVSLKESDPNTPLDLNKLFGREDVPRILEIGFGNGQTLLQQAIQRPEQDFIGIEVFRTGVNRLLQNIHEKQLSNIRIFCEDAIEVLDIIPYQSLEKVQLFFPDPWPKRKHHKRRIVQPVFVEKIAHKIKSGGLFHLATDWAPYAQHMLDVLEACDLFKNKAGKNQYTPRPTCRFETKFEKRGNRLGHQSFDLIYQRVN